MDNNHELLEFITKERPVGSDTNKQILAGLEEKFKAAEYEVLSLPFRCLVWQQGSSQMKIGDVEVKLNVSPYSKAFNGSGEVVVLETLKDLEHQDLNGKIAVLCGKLAEQPLQPKDFPFYYPDEDKAVITLLEQKKPKAVIGVTGKSQLCGMNPFPLFEDGNFLIPSAYVGMDKMMQIKEMINKQPYAMLTINSKTAVKPAKQIAAHRKNIQSKEKIIVCAHMDSKYNTPGALDNAAGVCVLMQIMNALKDDSCPVEFVPFNSEEYFGADGEVHYLEYIQHNHDKIALVINIDSPCHLNSKTAVSYYNLSRGQESMLNGLIENERRIIRGDEWYSGDHCAFVFQGVPCLAVTSSDLFEGGLEYTHTPYDTLKTVDEGLISETAKFLSALIRNWHIN